MHKYLILTASALAFASCAPDTTAPKTAEQAPAETTSQKPDLQQMVVTADVYPAPPEPHYGPQAGSIEFVDTDPGETIGGMMYMKPAIDENGTPVNAAENGITQYMIHWGLVVGEPGVEDDAGNGDLGGNCRGFRDTGHVVMKMAEDAGDLMKWEIPQGTEVPEGAVYFVGHTLYDKIHNLGKCTQTPIVNLVKN